jgi:hypothetical protein
MFRHFYIVLLRHATTHQHIDKGLYMQPPTHTAGTTEYNVEQT